MKRFMLVPAIWLLVASQARGGIFNAATGHWYDTIGSGTGAWSNAESNAIALGGHLVTINDAAEQTWLNATFGSDTRYWIGFTDSAVEDTWAWASGESVSYTNWAADEPNDYLGGEDYAVLNWNSTGAWNDLPDSYYYIDGIGEFDPITTPLPPPDVTLDGSNAVGPAVGFSGAGLIGSFRDYPDDIEISSFDDPDLVNPPIDTFSALVNLINFPDLGPDPLDVFVTTGSTGVPSLGVNDVTVPDLIEGDGFFATDSTFVVTFSGFINIGTPGVYEFIVGHDDGTRLNIGGQSVIDFNAPTDFRETWATVEFLDPGLYPIDLSLFENFWEADLVFSWIPPGGTRQLVPTEVLHPIPEPSSLIVWSLIGLACAGAGWWRWRQVR